MNIYTAITMFNFDKLVSYIAHWQKIYYILKILIG